MKKWHSLIIVGFWQTRYTLTDHRYPLIRKYKMCEMARRPRHVRRKCRKCNRILGSLRTYVELVFGEIKVFKLIGILFRHSRADMNQIVELCAGLSVRRVELLPKMYKSKSRES